MRSCLRKQLTRSEVPEVHLVLDQVVSVNDSIDTSCGIYRRRFLHRLLQGNVEAMENTGEHAILNLKL